LEAILVYMDKNRELSFYKRVTNQMLGCSYGILTNSESGPTSILDKIWWSMESWPIRCLNIARDVMLISTLNKMPILHLSILEGPKTVIKKG